MSGNPMVPISEVTDLGVLPSATATWYPGNGLSESTVTVMGGLEHSVRLEEQGLCEERLQSWYFSPDCPQQPLTGPTCHRPGHDRHSPR
jgi:hypothetical protein